MLRKVYIPLSFPTSGNMIDESKEQLTKYVVDLERCKFFFNNGQFDDAALAMAGSGGQAGLVQSCRTFEATLFEGSKDLHRDGLQDFARQLSIDSLAAMIDMARQHEPHYVDTLYHGLYNLKVNDAREYLSALRQDESLMSQAGAIFRDLFNPG